MLTPEPVNSIRKEKELKNAELWPLFKVPNFTLLYVIIFVPYLRRGKGKALQSSNNQPCCQVFETISSVAHDLAEWRWWRHTHGCFIKVHVRAPWWRLSILPKSYCSICFAKYATLFGILFQNWFKALEKCRLFLLNSLSPKSDQHEISPYNINALENRVVMRIEYMNQWGFQQILPTTSIKKVLVQ